jgi:hypothetical protein
MRDVLGVGKTPKFRFRQYSVFATANERAAKLMRWIQLPRLLIDPNQHFLVRCGWIAQG